MPVKSNEAPSNYDITDCSKAIFLLWFYLFYVLECLNICSFSYFYLSSGS